MHDWHTPLTTDAKGSTNRSRAASGCLTDDVREGAQCLSVVVKEWPTPTAANPNATEPLAAWLARRERLAAKHGNNGMGTPLGVAVRIDWPTPCAATNRKSRRALTASTDNGRRAGGGQSSPPGLEQAAEMAAGHVPPELAGLAADEVPAATRALFPAAWPTPTVNGNHNKAGLSPKSGDGLATAVRRGEGASGSARPTPTARDHKDGGYPAEYERKSPGLCAVAMAEDGDGLPLDERTRAEHIAELDAAAQGPGPLSPDWCETLMALPVGWTNPDAPLPVPRDDPGAPATPADVARALAALRWPARPGEPQGAWEPPRCQRGVRHRAARLTACGNAVVWPQAACALRRLV